jgi:serine/threonine-protein kinase HipA
MRRTIRVAIGDNGHDVGLLHHDGQGGRENAAFQYSASWLGEREGFTIDPALPLVAGPQFHHRGRGGSLFHGAIADTGPDGWARRVILRDHAKRRQEARREGRDVSPVALSSLDFLLAVDDEARVGALRFADERGVFQRAAEEGRRTVPPLVELGALLSASRAVEANEETAVDLAYLRGRGTSLGGLRPKCTVVDDDGSLSIGKFPSVGDDRAVTKGEILALRLAAAAGIDAARGRLIESDGQSIALIRRFDRPVGGGRSMYVSAATMIGAEEGEGAEHSYTEIVDALRTHGVAPQTDTEELWRRIAFSVLITNVDDHLHNHGFLHVSGGLWRLAPAFDVNPFPERARELKTWISEEVGPEARIDGLIGVLPYFRISRDTAVTILIQMEEAVSRWRDVGRDIGMTARELDQFADAFEHGERAAARKVIASRGCGGRT